MEEKLHVMPYLQRDEKPPRTYRGDDVVKACAVQRWAASLSQC